MPRAEEEKRTLMLRGERYSDISYGLSDNTKTGALKGVVWRLFFKATRLQGGIYI